MRRLGLWVLMTVLALAAVAVACGDDEDGSTAEEPSGGTAATATQPAQPTQPSGGSARVTVTATNHPQLGRILTDADGKTLYVFTRDGENTSTCYDQCERTWPPLFADSGTPTAGEGVMGRLGVTTRRDGRQQVTYDGKPLYYYQADQAAGEARGQGVNGAWFVVQVNQAAGGAGQGGGTTGYDYTY